MSNGWVADDTSMGAGQADMSHGRRISSSWILLAFIGFGGIFRPHAQARRWWWESCYFDVSQALISNFLPCYDFVSFQFIPLVVCFNMFLISSVVNCNCTFNISIKNLRLSCFAVASIDRSLKSETLGESFENFITSISRGCRTLYQWNHKMLINYVGKWMVIFCFR